MAVFRFVEFEADEERFELRYRGQRCSLQRIALDLLFHLIHHRERVVTKRELHGGPWGGAQVTEAALARAVMLVRRATSAARQPIIETVRGRGYRFVAPLDAGGAVVSPGVHGTAVSRPASRWLDLIQTAETIRLTPEIVRALLERGLADSQVLLIVAPLEASDASQRGSNQGTSGSGTD